MSETLLDYAINPTPNPIQASPSTGDPSLASLTLVASSPPHHTITCGSIALGFRIGANAEDFCSDATGISSSLPKGWSVEQQKGLFSFTPDTENDGQVGKDGLVFGLSGIKVNQEPGTFQITIFEEASDPDALSPAADLEHTLSLPMAKFPAQFTVGDLNANPPIVESGGSTTLSWSGSGGSGNYNAVYEIQYVDADGNKVTIDHPKGEENQPLPPAGGYTIDGLKANPTTFYLLVTVQIQGSNNPLVFTRETTVTVTVPHPPKPVVTGYTGELQPEGGLLLEWTASPPEATVEITSIPIIFQNTGTYPFHPTPEQPLLSSFTLTAKNGSNSASKTLVQQGFQPAAGSLVTVGKEPLSVAVSPDGARVFVADRSDTLTVLDAHTLQPVAGSPVIVGGLPWSVAVSRDGTRVFVANQQDQTLTVLDAQKLQPVAGSPVTVGAYPTSVAISPDGTLVFVANLMGNTLTVLDTQKLQPAQGSPVTVGTYPTSVAMSPDGTRVFVANYGDNNLTVLGPAAYVPAQAG